MKNLTRLEQIMQLKEMTEDGDLISKADRDALVEFGLAARIHGQNIITTKGIQKLYELGLLTAEL